MYTRKGLVLCAVLLTAAIALTALAPVLPAHAEGGAPVAQNLELTTYRNVSVGGRLSAVDPDGGTLTYQIPTGAAGTTLASRPPTPTATVRRRPRSSSA